MMSILNNERDYMSVRGAHIGTRDESCTNITEASSEPTESSKEKISDFHDLYKADDSTPPRFKSFVEINENIATKKRSSEEQKEPSQSKLTDAENEYSTDEKDKILIKLEGVSSRESTKYSNSGQEKTVKAYVIFQRPNWEESVCSESKETIPVPDEFSPPKSGKVSIESKITKPTSPRNVSPKTSINSQKIMQGLKLYKLWEQREKDFGDSKIGLDAWQMEEEENKESEEREIIKDEWDDEDDVIDDEILELLNQQDISELDEQEYKSFGVLWSIIDFVYSYDNFQFSLIKLALTAPPNIITQQLNDSWYVPKDLKEDLTTYVKDIADKYKRIPIKIKPVKVKKEKVKKEKKEKKVKEPKVKPVKLTKAEKAALKEEAKLRKKLEQAEAEAKLREENNKKFLFPLQDAAPEDTFFKEKFKNFKKVNIKKGKGKGKGKK